MSITLNKRFGSKLYRASCDWFASIWSDAKKRSRINIAAGIRVSRGLFRISSFRTFSNSALTALPRTTSILSIIQMWRLYRQGDENRIYFLPSPTWRPFGTRLTSEFKKWCLIDKIVDFSGLMAATRSMLAIYELIN